MLLSEGSECLEFLPTVDHRAGIDFLDPFEDAVTEFLPRVDPDMSQESTRHLAERVSAILSQEPWVGVSTYLKRLGRVAK